MDPEDPYMARDTGRGWLPTLHRRDTLALLGLGGVGGVSVPGMVSAFAPETIVGLPRGEGAPVTVEQELTDEAVDYRPASDTVRWSRSTGEGGPYTTEPFGTWASRTAASVGSDAVLPAIRERLDGEATGIGNGVSDELVGMVIAVSIGTTYDREGQVVSEPNVSLEELVDVTPRTVRTTVTLEGREYTRPVAVFVEEGEVHED